MAMSEDSRPAERSMLQGRGGAGNFAPRSPALTPADLKTPVIKSDLYTTGRGGTGNMALNLHSHPEFARASQDVDNPPLLGREPDGSVHYGRGGAANVARLSSEAKAGGAGAAAKEKREGGEEAGAAAVAAPAQKEPEKEKEKEEGKPKSKNFVQQGLQRLSRALSSNGEVKK